MPADAGFPFVVMLLGVGDVAPEVVRSMRGMTARRPHRWTIDALPLSDDHRNLQLERCLVRHKVAESGRRAALWHG
jgi:hypothetical protein